MCNENLWIVWMHAVNKWMVYGFQQTSLCWLVLGGITVKLIWQEGKTAFFSRSSSKGRRPVSSSVSLTAPVLLQHTHMHMQGILSTLLTDNFSFGPQLWYELRVFLRILTRTGRAMNLCVCVCVLSCSCGSLKCLWEDFMTSPTFCHNIWDRQEGRREKVVDTCNHP